ncbi:MAG: hypothetical protein ACHQAQ_19180 [Hyphomicrobiales bacterium]
MESDQLIRPLVERVITEGTASEGGTQQHVTAFRQWQMPMYHLDFNVLDVPLAELKEERGAMMWVEAGVRTYGY